MHLKKYKENHKILYFYKNKIYMWRFSFMTRIRFHISALQSHK